MVLRIVRAASIALLFMTSLGQAGEPDGSLSELIDGEIQARLQEASVVAADPVDDAGFLRRVSLDLAGRIPTRQEWMAFAGWEAEDKREQWVDRLLDSPDYAFQLRNELDILLLARKTHNDPWRDYLLEACRENRPWDQIFREILLPEYERPDEPGPAAFIRERVQDLDDLTNEASSLLFGVNIACAKCHDHPLVDDWEQQHYFGMAMFFKRTYRTRDGLVAERPDGALKFVNHQEEEKLAEFMFLTGAKAEEPELKLSDEERKRIDELVRKAEQEEKAERPPLPEFSPRKQVVALATSCEDRRFLTRNIVNRTWARLMGRGLVHPLDQMHAENVASHPQLLEALSADFAAHDYDLRRLVRGIVMSRAYGRSSRWEGEGDVPQAELYAVAAARPLSPWQLSLSLLVATRNPEQLAGLEKPEGWAEQRQQLESQSTGLARRFEIPEDGFQVGAEEALFFNNAAEIDNEYLRDSDDRLVGLLKATDEVDSLVGTAFAAILTRQPNEEERQAVIQYIQNREDRRTEALRQVVWALLTSPEFRFNS